MGSEIDFSDVSVVLASMNEEAAVEPVIDSIQKITKNQCQIIVVDSSTDNTAKIAQGKGVTVVRDMPPKGIGAAIIKGFTYITGRYVITIDLDGTYPVEAIPEVVRFLQTGFDVVSIVRLNGLKTKNMTTLNILGNLFFVFLVNLLYSANISDVTTGMRGFCADFIQSNQWQTNYALSSELIIKAIQQNRPIKELHYPYYPRIGQTKLKPFKHGIEIFFDIMKSKIMR